MTDLLPREEVISLGGREDGTDFRVREPARDRSVTTVPKFLDQFTSLFGNQKFYECAGIKIDDCHT
jgi:hypothetical protein